MWQKICRFRIQGIPIQIIYGPEYTYFLQWTKDKLQEWMEHWFLNEPPCNFWKNDKCTPFNKLMLKYACSPWVEKSPKISKPSKVHIFWEGHKTLRNLHFRFDRGVALEGGR